MRYRIEYAAVMAIRAVVGVLPHSIAHALGGMLGVAFYMLDRGHRRVAVTNLVQAFPTRTHRDVRVITRNMFKHFGRLLFEMLKFSTLSHEAMLRRVEFEGEDRARLAYAQGRGVLFFTGHFGFWELHAIVHGLQLRPIGVLARTLDNPYLNSLLEQVRGSTGNSVIYRQGAVRRVLKTLAAGEGVAMLIDQHMHSADAIWVDFFQRPAATTSTLAALALRTGAPVVPVFALPLEGGRYRMIYEHAVQPPASDSPDAIREFTQRCTDVLEMYVRRHPELWLWMHRRWRDTPMTQRQGMVAPARQHNMSAQPSKLVVVAPNWLGDAVMALPLLADLRRAWPHAEIVVAARRAVAPLFAMVPGVSGTLPLDGGGGRQAIGASKRNAALLRSGNFDAALLLPNSFLSAWIAWRAGIMQRWGFARDMRTRLLTRALPPPKNYGHQAEYYQALASGLGVPVGDRHASLSVPAQARANATALLRESTVADRTRFVVLAPGAAYGRAKQWLPERFAELAQLLAQSGTATVLVGGKGDTRACQEVATLAGRQGASMPLVDLCGRTDLPTLAALFAMAEAVVANDSGAMHLAAAVGARVTAVFGPTDDRRTAPLRASDAAPAPRIVATTVWCRPCMLRECPIDHRCMSDISAQQVLEATT